MDASQKRPNFWLAITPLPFTLYCIANLCSVWEHHADAGSRYTLTGLYLAMTAVFVILLIVNVRIYVRRRHAETYPQSRWATILLKIGFALWLEVILLRGAGLFPGWVSWQDQHLAPVLSGAGVIMLLLMIWAIASTKKRPVDAVDAGLR